jgi:ribosomal protein L11 methyltransferase
MNQLMTDWMEVSMTVNGEQAEAVSEVFARFAPNGVVSEQAVDFVNEEDEGTPVGPITVRAYLPVDEQLPESRLKLEEALFYLGMIQKLPEPVYTTIQDQNWMEKWKMKFQPISVGRHLEIMYSWQESQLDPLRIPLKISPGMAFGTGTHPSTQLMLELLEDALREFRVQKKSGPLDVIDIGCGSGILSIAALKLGASRALGVDVDDIAIANSRENAQLNGVENQILLGAGSVKEIREGGFAFTCAPIVLTNILSIVIIRLFNDGLGELVTPDGVLILSGILADQADSVVEAASMHGFNLVEKRTMVDWVALAVKR